MSFGLDIEKRLFMLDLFYVAIGLLFFSLCWALTKACEKL